MSTIESQLARLVELYRMYRLSQRGGAFVPFPPKGASQAGRRATRTPMAGYFDQPDTPGESQLLSGAVSYLGCPMPAPFVREAPWELEARYPLIGGIPASRRASLMCSSIRIRRGASS
jgi:hypothetical protein